MTTSPAGCERTRDVRRGISKARSASCAGRIATLVDEAANNEKLLKRSQERELELLKAENLAQLFEAICNGLKASYALESVTLLLLDPQHEIRHLLIADHMSIEDFPERAVRRQPSWAWRRSSTRSTGPGSGPTWAAITSCCFRGSRRCAASR